MNSGCNVQSLLGGLIYGDKNGWCPVGVPNRRTSLRTDRLGGARGAMESTRVLDSESHARAHAEGGADSLRALRSVCTLRVRIATNRGVVGASAPVKK